MQIPHEKTRTKLEFYTQFNWLHCSWSFIPYVEFFFLPKNSNKNDDVISLGIAVDILKVPSLFASNFTNMIKSILFLLVIS